MASLSADRYKNNAPLSVFDGIPVTAKDELRIVSKLICSPFASELITKKNFHLFAGHSVVNTMFLKIRLTNMVFIDQENQMQ